jgi:hypothetical protein
MPSFTIGLRPVPWARFRGGSRGPRSDDVFGSWFGRLAAGALSPLAALGFVAADGRLCVPGRVVVGPVERLHPSGAARTRVMRLPGRGVLGTAVTVTSARRGGRVGRPAVLAIGLPLDGRLCVPGGVVVGPVERLRWLLGASGIAVLPLGVPVRQAVRDPVPQAVRDRRETAAWRRQRWRAYRRSLLVLRGHPA